MGRRHPTGNTAALAARRHDPATVKQLPTKSWHQTANLKPQSDEPGKRSPGEMGSSPQSGRSRPVESKPETSGTSRRRKRRGLPTSAARQQQRWTSAHSRNAAPAMDRKAQPASPPAAAHPGLRPLTPPGPQPPRAETPAPPGGPRSSAQKFAWPTAPASPHHQPPGTPAPGPWRGTA